MAIPPLDRGVLARGAPVVDDDIAILIASHADCRSLSLEHEHFTLVLNAEFVTTRFVFAARHRGVGCGRLVQLVDKDGDIIASAGERVFTKTPGKGLYIAFKYNILEVEVESSNESL